MEGGAGDGVYCVHRSYSLDLTGPYLVVEAANGGHDVVYGLPPVTDFTLWDDVEDLHFTEGFTTVHGNAQDNHIFASGNDVVPDGGADTPESSGTGNATHVLDSAGDVVIDGGGWHDTVRINGADEFFLCAGIEKLTFQLGGAAVHGTTGAE